MVLEGSDMRSVRTIPSLILSLLSFFPWAFAQSPVPSLEVFLEGGASFLTGSSGHIDITEVCPAAACPIGGPCSCPSLALTNSFSTAARLIVGGRYRFTPRNALEASYSYSPNRFTIQPQGQAALSAYNRVDLISFNYVRYFFPPQSRVQPFATAGVGVNRFSGPSNAPAVLDGYTSADNGWDFAWNFGFGGDLVLARYAVFRFELKDYVTGLPPVRNITGTCQGVVPSVGLVFRFK